MHVTSQKGIKPEQFSNYPVKNEVCRKKMMKTLKLNNQVLLFCEVGYFCKKMNIFLAKKLQAHGKFVCSGHV